MSYVKQTWNTGDTITAEKLNHMEDGIATTGGGGHTLPTSATLMVTKTGEYDAGITYGVDGLNINVTVNLDTDSETGDGVVRIDEITVESTGIYTEAEAEKIKTALIEAIEGNQQELHGFIGQQTEGVAEPYAVTLTYQDEQSGGVDGLFIVKGAGEYNFKTSKYDVQLIGKSYEEIVDALNSGNGVLFCVSYTLTTPKGSFSFVKIFEITHNLSTGSRDLWGSRVVWQMQSSGTKAEGTIYEALIKEDGTAQMWTNNKSIEVNLS